MELPAVGAPAAAAVAVAASLGRSLRHIRHRLRLCVFRDVHRPQAHCAGDGEGGGGGGGAGADGSDGARWWLHWLWH